MNVLDAMGTPFTYKVPVGDEYTPEMNWLTPETIELPFAVPYGGLLLLTMNLYAVPPESQPSM